MNRSARHAASLAALALLTFGPASHASTVSSVAPSVVVTTGAFEAVGAVASRVLDPSLQSASLAGSGITDATFPPPSTVPEPESIALFGLGLAAMFVTKRRKAHSPG